MQRQSWWLGLASLTAVAACTRASGGGNGQSPRIPEIEPNDTPSLGMELVSSVFPAPWRMEGTCSGSGDEDWFVVQYPSQTIMIDHSATLSWNDEGATNLDLKISRNATGTNPDDEDDTVPPNDAPAVVTLIRASAGDEIYVGVTCTTAAADTRWILDLDVTVASPTPPPGPGASPTPTPYPASYCSLLWSSPGSAAGLYNVYELNMPVSSWTSGTKTHNDVDILGLFYRDYEPASGNVTAFGYADGGTVDVTVGGLQPGTAVTMADAASQTYLDAFGVAGVIATGGNGSFTGVWSNPDSVGGDFPESAGADAGAGTLAMRHSAMDLTLGSTQAWGVCFEPAN